MGKKRKNRNNRVPFTVDNSEEGQTTAIIDYGAFADSNVCTATCVQVSNF
jgi:hypothetical protein